MSDRPGHSAPDEVLDSLPYEVDRGVRPVTASAKLIESQYVDDNTTGPQDPRLRSGSVADQHRAAIRAAIVDLGYIVPGASQLNQIAHSVPMGGNVVQAVAEMGLPKAPVKARSAENVLRRRI